MSGKFSGREGNGALDTINKTLDLLNDVRNNGNVELNVDANTKDAEKKLAEVKKDITELPKAAEQAANDANKALNTIGDTKQRKKRLTHLDYLNTDNAKVEIEQKRKELEDLYAKYGSDDGKHGTPSKVERMRAIQNYEVLKKAYGKTQDEMPEHFESLNKAMRATDAKKGWYKDDVQATVAGAKDEYARIIDIGKDQIHSLNTEVQETKQELTQLGNVAETSVGKVGGAADKAKGKLKQMKDEAKGAVTETSKEMQELQKFKAEYDSKIGTKRNSGVQLGQEYIKLQNAIKDGMSADDAITAMKKKTEELGMKFDDTKGKWEKMKEAVSTPIPTKDTTDTAVPKTQEAAKVQEELGKKASEAGNEAVKAGGKITNSLEEAAKATKNARDQMSAYKEELEAYNDRFNKEGTEGILKTASDEKENDKAIGINSGSSGDNKNEKQEKLNEAQAKKSKKAEYNEMQKNVNKSALEAFRETAYSSKPSNTVELIKEIAAAKKEFDKYFGENGTEKGFSTEQMSEEGRKAALAYYEKFQEVLNSKMAEAPKKRYAINEDVMNPDYLNQQIAALKEAQTLPKSTGTTSPVGSISQEMATTAEKIDDVTTSEKKMGDAGQEAGEKIAGAMAQAGESAREGTDKIKNAAGQVAESMNSGKINTPGILDVEKVKAIDDAYEALSTTIGKLYGFQSKEFSLFNTFVKSNVKLGVFDQYDTSTRLGYFKEALNGLETKVSPEINNLAEGFKSLVKGILQEYGITIEDVTTAEKKMGDVGAEAAEKTSNAMQKAAGSIKAVGEETARATQGGGVSDGNKVFDFINNIKNNHEEMINRWQTDSDYLTHKNSLIDFSGWTKEELAAIQSYLASGQSFKDVNYVPTSHGSLVGMISKSINETGVVSFAELAETRKELENQAIEQFKAENQELFVQIEEFVNSWISARAAKHDPFVPFDFDAVFKPMSQKLFELFKVQPVDLAKSLQDKAQEANWMTAVKWLGNEIIKTDDSRNYALSHGTGNELTKLIAQLGFNGTGIWEKVASMLSGSESGEKISESTGKAAENVGKLGEAIDQVGTGDNIGQASATIAQVGEKAEDSRKKVEELADVVNGQNNGTTHAPIVDSKPVKEEADKIIEQCNLIKEKRDELTTQLGHTNLNKNVSSILDMYSQKGVESKNWSDKDISTLITNYLGVQEFGKLNNTSLTKELESALSELLQNLGVKLESLNAAKQQMQFLSLPKQENDKEILSVEQLTKKYNELTAAKSAQSEINEQYIETQRQINQLLLDASKEGYKYDTESKTFVNDKQYGAQSVKGYERYWYGVQTKEKYGVNAGLADNVANNNYTIMEIKRLIQWRQEVDELLKQANTQKESGYEADKMEAIKTRYSELKDTFDKYESKGMFLNPLLEKDPLNKIEENIQMFDLLIKKRQEYTEEQGKTTSETTAVPSQVGETTSAMGKMGQTASDAGDKAAEAMKRTGDAAEEAGAAIEAEGERASAAAGNIDNLNQSLNNTNADGASSAAGNIQELGSASESAATGVEHLANAENGLNTQSSGITDGQNAVQGELGETAEAVNQTAEAINTYQELLDKSFATSNASQALEQLREAYTRFQPFSEEAGGFIADMSQQGRETAYSYIKAFEEAIKQGVSQTDLNQYLVKSLNLSDQGQLSMISSQFEAVFKDYSEIFQQNWSELIQIDPVFENLTDSYIRGLERLREIKGELASVKDELTREQKQDLMMAKGDVAIPRANLARKLLSENQAMLPGNEQYNMQQVSSDVELFGKAIIDTTVYTEKLGDALTHVGDAASEGMRKAEEAAKSVTESGTAETKIVDSEPVKTETEKIVDHINTIINEKQKLEDADFIGKDLFTKKLTATLELFKKNGPDFKKWGIEDIQKLVDSFGEIDRIFSKGNFGIDVAGLHIPDLVSDLSAQVKEAKKIGNIADDITPAVKASEDLAKGMENAAGKTEETKRKTQELSEAVNTQRKLFLDAFQSKVTPAARSGIDTSKSLDLDKTYAELLNKIIRENVPASDAIKAMNEKAKELSLAFNEKTGKWGVDYRIKNGTAPITTETSTTVKEQKEVGTAADETAEKVEKVKTKAEETAQAVLRASETLKTYFKDAGKSADEITDKVNNFETAVTKGNQVNIGTMGKKGGITTNVDELIKYAEAAKEVGYVLRQTAQKSGDLKFDLIKESDMKGYTDKTQYKFLDVEKLQEAKAELEKFSTAYQEALGKGIRESDLSKTYGQLYAEIISGSKDATAAIEELNNKTAELMAKSEKSVTPKADSTEKQVSETQQLTTESGNAADAQQKIGDAAKQTSEAIGKATEKQRELNAAMQEAPVGKTQDAVESLASGIENATEKLKQNLLTLKEDSGELMYEDGDLALKNQLDLFKNTIQQKKSLFAAQASSEDLQYLDVNALKAYAEAAEQVGYVLEKIQQDELNIYQIVPKELQSGEIINISKLQEVVNEVEKFKAVVSSIKGLNPNIDFGDRFDLELNGIVNGTKTVEQAIESLKISYRNLKIPEDMLQVPQVAEINTDNINEAVKGTGEIVAQTQRATEAQNALSAASSETAEKMNEIVENAKNIPTQITATPSVTDVTTAPSQVQSAVSEKPAAFNQEKTTVDQAVESEIASLERLAQKIREVTKAVNDKIVAFTMEQSTVNKASIVEVAALQTLLSKIQNITEGMATLTKAFGELPPINIRFGENGDGSAITETVTKQLDAIKAAFEGFQIDKIEGFNGIMDNFKVSKTQVTNIENLIQALGNLKEKLTSLTDIDASNGLIPFINELLSHAEDFKNIVKVLGTSQVKIQQAVKIAEENNKAYQEKVIADRSKAIESEIQKLADNDMFGVTLDAVQRIYDEYHNLVKAIVNVQQSVYDENGTLVDQTATTQTLTYDRKTGSVVTSENQATNNESMSQYIDQLNKALDLYRQLSEKKVTGSLSDEETRILENASATIQEVLNKRESEVELTQEEIEALRRYQVIQENIKNLQEQTTEQGFAKRGQEFYQESLRDIEAYLQAQTRLNEAKEKEANTSGVNEKAHAAALLEVARATEEVTVAREKATKAYNGLVSLYNSDITSYLTPFTHTQMQTATDTFNQAKAGGTNESIAALNIAEGQRAVREAYQQNIDIIHEAIKARDEFNNMNADLSVGKLISDSEIERIKTQLTETEQKANDAKQAIENMKASLSTEQYDFANVAYGLSKTGTQASPEKLDAQKLKTDKESIAEAKKAMDDYYESAKKVRELAAKSASGESVGKQLSNAITKMNEFKQAAEEAFKTYEGFATGDYTQALGDGLKEYTNKMEEAKTAFSDGMKEGIWGKDVKADYERLIANASKYVELSEKAASGKSLTLTQSNWLSQYTKLYEDAINKAGEFSVADDKAYQGVHKDLQTALTEQQRAYYLNKSETLGNRINTVGDQALSQEGTQKLAEVKQKYEDLRKTIAETTEVTNDFRSQFMKQFDGIESDLAAFSGKNSPLLAATEESKAALQQQIDLQLSTVMPDATRRQIEALSEELKNVDDAGSLNRISSRLKEIQSGAKAASKSTQSFGSVMKKAFSGVTRYLMMYTSVYRLIGTFKQAVNVVKELDTNMTNIKKVTEESTSTIENFMKNSFDMADKMGTTASQIQQGMATWLRLGKNFNQAAEASQATSWLMNISGMDNVDTASKSLVSISQAYKDLSYETIIDKLSNIGDHFSSSVEGLAEGLQNASAVLLTQGNDIDQALALLTAGNDVLQDMSKVSTGI